MRTSLRMISSEDGVEWRGKRAERDEDEAAGTRRGNISCLRAKNREIMAFVDLPNDVLILILHNLSLSALAALSQTSSALHQLVCFSFRIYLIC